MHSTRPPSAPPTTSASHARPSPVQTSHHNDDSYGVTQRGHFAAQLQNQPLQPPPSAVAVGARAASVSTTPTRRTTVQRVWSVPRPCIIQSQFYQAPPAAQQQPSTKSRSLHAGPTSAAHHKPTAPPCLPHDPAPSAAQKYKRLLAAAATLARVDGVRGSGSTSTRVVAPPIFLSKGAHSIRSMPPRPIPPQTTQQTHHNQCCAATVKALALTD